MKVGLAKVTQGGVLAALGFLGACSSAPPTVEVTAAKTSSVNSVQIYKTDTTTMLQNSALGTIPFFYGGSRGLNAGAIRWNQPVTSENPGADCDLSYTEGKGGTSHFFRCIVKEGNEHIIVSVQEDLVEGRRLMRRIFMDGKGKALVDQWGSALERIGYRKAKGGAAATQHYVSADRASVADVIWVSSSQSVTLRISPKF